MNIKEAIASVFINWRDFRGRACRSEFWYFTLASYLVFFLIEFVELNLGLSGHPVSTLYTFFILVPAVSVTSRRLQDAGISGWWQLSYFAFIGFIVIPVICMFQGEDDQNRWGRNPLLKNEVSPEDEAQ